MNIKINRCLGNNKSIKEASKKKIMITRNIYAFKDLRPAHMPELTTLCIIITINNVLFIVGLTKTN